VQLWDVLAADATGRTDPRVLFSTPEARMVMVDLAAGERLGEHEVHERAIIQVEDFEEATSQLAQTTLRSVLGEHELDAMLAERKPINDNIQAILEEHYQSWGIRVLNVEIKNIDLDESMIRAIARQAEAERNRRAKVIDAEGELQAADRLRQAGEILAGFPQAMQLRSLIALQGIAGDKSSTIVFPLPMEIAGMLGVGRTKDGKGE